MQNTWEEHNVLYKEMRPHFYIKDIRCSKY